jgi:short-subunit dehydrogenase
MDNRESVVFVTGASSGIGNACATFLAKKGMRVYGTCRNSSSYMKKADEFFEMLSMELRDPASIAKAADKLLSREGKIDVLVCSAGSGLLGAVEDTSLDEAEALMDINFFGTLRTIKAFLPSMREAGKGKIIIVGALEGLVAAPYQGIFSAAAFALEGLAQALRIELAPFGIEVGILEITAFRTSFGQKRRVAVSETSPYRKGLDAAAGVLGRDEAAALDPLAAAKTVHAMLSANRLPRRTCLGPFFRRVIACGLRALAAQALDRHARSVDFMMRRYFRSD